MPNAIQQLLEKFLALTNEEQTIFFNAMVASRSGERINDMGMAFKDDIRFRDGIVCPYCGSKGKGCISVVKPKVASKGSIVSIVARPSHLPPTPFSHGHTTIPRFGRNTLNA